MMKLAKIMTATPHWLRLVLGGLLFISPPWVGLWGCGLWLEFPKVWDYLYKIAVWVEEEWREPKQQGEYDVREKWVTPWGYLFLWTDHSFSLHRDEGCVLTNPGHFDFCSRFLYRRIHERLAFFIAFAE